MATAKSNNQKEYTSKAGTKYVFQKVKPIDWLDIMDQCQDEQGKRSQKLLYKGVVENIIVNPQSKLEDWEDFGELDEVVTQAIRFQQNKQ